jgi:hypothetical protein
MNTDQSILKGRKELEEKIITKAWADENFKNQLKTHPKEAISQFGVSVSQGTEVKVLEETSNVAYLVLPTEPDQNAHVLYNYQGGCGKFTGTC